MKKLICTIAAAAMLLTSLPALAGVDKSEKAIPAEKTDNTVAFWDFETDPIADGWTFVDGDGDGHNWEVSTKRAYSGNNSLSSYSWENYVYYDPDNWAISPAVELPEESCAINFYGRHDNYTGVDVFRVYVGYSPDISAMSPVDSSRTFNFDTNIPLAFTMMSVDISEYAGETVYIAFRHFHSYEIGKRFFIDDVEIVSNFEPLAPPPEDLVYGCYFDDEEEYAGWQFADSDGDGFGWNFTINPRFAYNSVGVVGSESLVTGPGGGPVTPDNWLISPGIQLPSDDLSLSFYASGVDTIYNMYVKEHFSVYAGTTPDIEDMTEIIPETETTIEFQLYTADLSEFANQTVYIAIRHHNCYYENWLRVDNFEVWGSGTYPTEPPAPTRIYGDVNLNGVVELEDALLLMRYLISLEELNEAQLDMAEVQGNNSIGIEDALLIMRYVLQTIAVFPRALIDG